MADLQPLSRRTDRHFNMRGDMMSLMHSDVTFNREKQPEPSQPPSGRAALAGVEEILSPLERTQAMKKGPHDPGARSTHETAVTILLWTYTSYRKLMLELSRQG